MRWSDERYVRLYTRDTITWKRLGWEGRACLPQILRKLDRAGLLELGGLPPAEALSLAIDCPLDLATAALKRLLEVGTVTLQDDMLLVPGFLDAQEAVATGRLRSEVWRARNEARSGASRGVTSGDGASQQRNVTPSNAPSPARDAPLPTATPEAAAQRHATDATPSRTTPSSTTLRSALPPTPTNVADPHDRVAPGVSGGAAEPASAWKAETLERIKAHFGVDELAPQFRGFLGGTMRATTAQREAAAEEFFKPGGAADQHKPLPYLLAMVNNSDGRARPAPQPQQRKYRPGESGDRVQPPDHIETARLLKESRAEFDAEVAANGGKRPPIPESFRKWGRRGNGKVPDEEKPEQKP